MDFNKIYVIDTNIILDSFSNILKLSSNSENLIVVPDIVLKELRKYKVGFEDINYQARLFNRMLNDSEVIETKQESVILKVSPEDSGDSIIIEIYRPVWTKDISNMENDDLIVATAKVIQNHYNKNVIMLSNDIDVRTCAILEKIKTESLKIDSDTSLEFNFHMEIESEHNFRSGGSIEHLAEITGLNIPYHISSFEIRNPVTGKPSYFYRKNNHLEALDESMLAKQNIAPLNLPQKYMSSFILDDSINIIVVEARAGAGKNAISLSSAMRLLDTRRDLYNKIVYIRKTVPSVDKESQIGFLKGSEQEKMKGFNAPLYDTLEFMVEKKSKGKTKPTKEALEEGVTELINKYNIEVSWEGHLRGSTIRNAVVIIDEASNFSRKSLQLILTRLGDNTKAIILGSNRQNDSYYLNKYTNGLTHTLKLCNKPIKENVTLAGVILQKAIRSPISEWADSAYE